MSTATTDPTTFPADRKQITDDPATHDDYGSFDGIPTCVGYIHAEATSKLYASVSDLLTTPAIPREGPHVVTEADGTHAMYLDGFFVGFACTPDEAQTTLAELIADIQWMEEVATADMAALRLQAACGERA